MAEPSPASPSSPPAPAAVRIVISTAPPGVAHDIARRLVEEGLAACVNLVPGVRSVYRWQGAVQDDPETLLVIKTGAERLGDLERRLKALHPYQVPEVLALTPSEGAATYLAWVLGSASPPGPPPSEG